jgi:tetratricopeptide (TPR) repeat protein
VSHESERTIDVSTLLSASERALRTGKLDEARTLIDQVLEAQHDCAEAHLLLGDVYHSQGLKEDARDSYILAACFKPAWPLPLARQGLLAFNQGELVTAIALLNNALTLEPGSALVHNILGAAYLRAHQFDSALHHLREAIALQPDLAEAHSNIGLLLFRELERFEEGADHLQTALSLKPTDPDVLCNWAMVLQHRGLQDDALKLCNELLMRHPSLYEAALIRGLILLTRGEYLKGWEDYEYRKRTDSNYERRTLPWPEWSGTDLTRKTVYVYTEQGLGDEIMFASCLPDLILRAGKCVCECSPKLSRLFARSFPGAEIVPKDTWKSPDWGLVHRPDVQVAIGSLPRFFRSAVDAFPLHAGYLQAEPDRVAYWRTELAGLPGKKKVGISWRGGAQSTRRVLRSIPLHEWASIISLDDIDFICLQYSAREEELAEGRALGRGIQHWPHALEDYSDTAALVTALDLVISVQTAVVHLAGALGKPTWALISGVPEWRYGGAGQSMPWYPSVRLFRPAETGTWDSALAEVRTELATWSAA